MKFSRDEEEISAKVLGLVDYDLNKLAGLVARIRDEFDVPEEEPVFMQDVLDYLLGKSRFAPRANSRQKATSGA